MDCDGIKSQTFWRNMMREYKRDNPFANIRLQTERLILRQWRESDAGDLFSYARGPLVGPMAGWAPHRSIEESRRLIKRFMELGTGVVFCIEEKESGRAIGSISLDKDNRRNGTCLVLGYALNSRYWGRGYMTEAVRKVLEFAFVSLRCKLITVTHYPENLRSKRVIEKNGFRFEGRLRSCAVRYNGEVTDLMFYSLTVGEFYAERADEAGLSLKTAEEIAGEKIDKFSADLLRADCFSGIPPYAIASFADEGRGLYMTDARGEVLGAIRIVRQYDEEGEISFAFHPKVIERGLANLLLGLGLVRARDMGIHEVTLSADEKNGPAIRAILECGGVLSEGIQPKGENLPRKYCIRQ